VIRTRVGYAGGLKPHPTYSHIGDHTETVQVDYDPQRISYEQLLTVFWQNHDPSSRSWSRQYMNVIFYHDDNQRQRALASKAAIEKTRGHAVRSEVAPLHSFTLAEDYHQKYLLKQHHILTADLSRIYPNPRDLVDSTAAARINGYVGGHGNRDQFEREIGRLGLSDRGRQELSEAVTRRWRYDQS
jgi:peptide-methionine (S)-S-oxide reductase